MQRGATSAASNPILIGAVTVLVTLVAVVLAYDANRGLPFVETYDVRVRVDDADDLVAGNEVKVAGVRVGAVAGVRAVMSRDRRVGAEIRMELDRAVGPLPADSVATVRAASLLGKKYLEIRPGRSRRGLPAGGLLRRSTSVGDVQDLFDTFDRRTRRAFGESVAEGAAALAGRGVDLNTTLAQAPPVLPPLTRVMTTLDAAPTDLSGFLRGTDAATGVLASRAPRLGHLVAVADETLGGLHRSRRELGEGIDELGPTEAVATRALRTTRPVLRGAAALARGLRPGARAIPVAARELASTFTTATPIMRRAVAGARQVDATLRTTGAVAADPAANGSLRMVIAALASLGPTLTDLNPYQTRCNYLGLWGRNVTSTLREGDRFGRWLRVGPVVEPALQLRSARPAPILHATTHTDASEECEIGNEPYAPGQVVGRAPGLQPNTTEATRPPAEIDPGR